MISPFIEMTLEEEKTHLLLNSTALDVSLEGKKVVVIDDVLYTGRSVRASLDAFKIMDVPLSIELLVLSIED